MTNLPAHHSKWDNLPAFPQWPYVMGDDDVEAWGDILYMRGLVDDLAHLCTSTRVRINGVFPPHHCDQSQADNPASLRYVPWPADHAEVLLAAWREQAAA